MKTRHAAVRGPIPLEPEFTPVPLPPSLYGEPPLTPRKPVATITLRNGSRLVTWALSESGRAYVAQCHKCKRLMFLDALAPRGPSSVQCPYCGVWELAP